MFNKISFILHKPQLSENIGACARAMKNFNFSRLVIIKPKPTFPNDKIIATSVGAKEIIKKSKVYENVESSLKNVDCLFVSCTALKIVDLIDDLEKELNINLISSNQAIIWDSLRLSKINQKINGFGRLFKTI